MGDEPKVYEIEICPDCRAQLDPDYDGDLFCDDCDVLVRPSKVVTIRVVEAP